MSFGELRTFDDSYNLAEPEPVLDPVILNFVPVPAVEADMADENVEAILQANPQPVPLVPDPGAQNIEGGGNNDQAEPPLRVPPHIKLDPNLPGVNLNMTVAEWVMLQEQYNADHAQRNDEEEDIGQEVFDNGIRVNADVHYNRRDDDNRSTDSTEAGGGLHRVVTHISKPVGVLLNPETTRLVLNVPNSI